MTEPPQSVGGLPVENMLRVVPRESSFFSVVYLLLIIFYNFLHDLISAPQHLYESNMEHVYTKIIQPFGNMFSPKKCFL